MVTQELITFVRQQLSLGKTKEQIKSQLIASGGWLDTDIEQAFAAANAPSSIPETSVLQNNITPSIEKKSGHNFPYGVIGVISIILFLIGAYTSFFRLVPVASIPKAVVALLLIGLLPVVILHVLTSLYKIPARSWGKAFFMAGVPGLLFFLIDRGVVYAGVQTGIVAAVITLGGIVAWVILFSRIYIVRASKAFWVGFWQMILSGIVGVILFFAIGLSILFSAVNSPMVPKTAVQENKPAQQVQDQNLPANQMANSPVVQTVTPQTSTSNAVTTNKNVCAAYPGYVQGQPFIKITSPTGGTYKIGQSMTVTWISCDLPSNASLVINSRSNDYDAFRLFSGTNSGKATFIIPAPSEGEDPRGTNLYLEIKAQLPGTHDLDGLVTDQTTATISIVN